MQARADGDLVRLPNSLCKQITDSLILPRGSMLSVNRKKQVTRERKQMAEEKARLEIMAQKVGARRLTGMMPLQQSKYLARCKLC